MRIAANVLKKVFHPAVWLIMLSAGIIAVAIYVGMFFWSVYSRGYEAESITARAESGFRVFYLENDIFDENPIPPTLGLLMSFTDFIQMRSRVEVELTNEADVFFSYAATKRMVIRHIETQDANRNPIVYERVIPLGTASGNMRGRSVSFSGGSGDGSWSYHTVLPKYFVQVYFDFIEAQRAKMEAEGVVALSQRGFSAELFVEFDYTVSVPSWGISEQVSRGYRISLTTEVYDLVVIGTHMVEADAVTGNIVQMFTLPNIGVDLERYEWLVTQHLLFCIVALVLIFGHGVFCFVTGAKMLARNPDPKKHEADVLFAKYSDVLVVSATPLSLYGYRTVDVEDFETLVKLAINNDTHIMAYRDPDEGAHFAVIIDDYAYEFKIVFEDDTDNHKPTAVVADVLVVVDNADNHEEEEEDDGLGDAVPEPGPTIRILEAMG